MRHPTEKNAAIIMILLAAVSIIAALMLPAIPQEPSYHSFADNRSFWGIPNTMDVLSNIPLAVLGALGIGICLKNCRHNLKTSAGDLKIVFFAALLLTGFGSSVYHWQPDNDSIVWDRLPLSVMFMVLFLVVLADRGSPPIARRLLWPTLIAGPASVLYWRWSEMQGAGDLRLYGIVQFLPLILIPATLILYPKGSLRSGDLWTAFAWYALAKILELLDRQVYEWTGVFSGHTLKHLFAAIGVFYLLRMCRRRDEYGLKKEG